MTSNVKKTQQTRARYDRVSRVYDLVEGVVERARFSGWRHRLWSQVKGTQVLEVGVGTGKNFPYYPAGISATGIDLSQGMLQQARKKADRSGLPVKLQLMDLQALGFADDSFDEVVATFVFCSVSGPVLGLREVRRVCRPHGRIYLLEHMRSGNRLLGWMMDILNPLTVRIGGENINRRTLENVQKSGLQAREVENLWSDVVRLVVAEPAKG